MTDCLGPTPRGPPAWNRGRGRTCRHPTFDSWRFGDLRPHICVTVDENAPGLRADGPFASDPLPQLAGSGVSGTVWDHYQRPTRKAHRAGTHRERTCRDPTCDSWRFGDLRPQICVTVDENAPGFRGSAALASDPLPQHVGEQPPLWECRQLPQMSA